LFDNLLLKAEDTVMKITKIMVKSKPSSAKKDVSYPPEIQAAIQMKAYELYLSRKNDIGSEVEDWLEAERIVLQKKHK
jgi:hypothetical protein